MAGPQSHAFQPGVSKKITATASSSRVALDFTGVLPKRQARVTVDGTDNAYIKFGTVSVVAAATDIFILTGTTEVFTIPAGAVTDIAAIADDATGCTVYLTAGNGM